MLIARFIPLRQHAPVWLRLSFSMCAAILALSTTGVAAPGRTQQLTSADEAPDGLEKSDWQSIRAVHESWQHAFSAVEGGYAAHTPGQQWCSHFDARGFLTEPTDGGWSWGMELQGYGFPGHERRPPEAPAQPHVSVAGQRLIRIWDESLQEWYVNDGRGLEHGFTIAERPAGAESGAPLGIALALRGTLRAQVQDGGQAVSFVTEAGGAALTYGGLKVWDADGTTLPARMVATGAAGLRFEIEERGARYPLTADPIAQQAYLKAGNNGPQSSDRFGYAVAVSGDTVVVGAHQEDSSSTGVNSTPNENAANAGAAYVFTRTAGVWTQQAYLKPAAVGSSQAGDYFGISVAISGDTLVVGANFEKSSSTGVNSMPNEFAPDAGAAYVFTRSAGVWTQQAYLKPSAVGTTQFGDNFGISVAVSDDTVVVGASEEDSGTVGVNSTPDESGGVSGAAYVFTRSAGVWTQQAYVKPAAVGTTQVGDNFGVSVGVSGDTMIVGAWREDSSTTGVNSTPNENPNFDSGAAYIFARSAGVWTQQAYLKPAAVGTTQQFDSFGISVAISGETVVVGARAEDNRFLSGLRHPALAGLQFSLRTAAH